MIRFDAFCESGTAPGAWPAIREDDIALLQYTGGTTGPAKGAMLTHANLTAAVSSYDIWFEALYGDPEEGEKVLCVLPLFHIYALTTILLLGIRRRAEIVLHMRFDATQVLNDIQAKKITTFPGVPTMWIALANHPDLMKTDLSSLVRCSSGGAPLPVEVGQRFEGLTGQRLAGGWGMTETSPAGTNLLPFGEAKPGSIGMPLPGVGIASGRSRRSAPDLGRRRSRRTPGARQERDGGLLEQAGRKQGRVCRRFLPYRRCRLHGARRLFPDRRPQEGHDHRRAASRSIRR